LEIQLIAHKSKPNHLSIVGSYNNLGHAYKLKGEYDKAIEQFNKALKIYEVVYARVSTILILLGAIII
jgi:tetratricopeptide (TPR) repeat protein